eukprot:Clim_evm17s29 gene=Clim_evmTU17s29
MGRRVVEGPTSSSAGVTARDDSDTGSMESLKEIKRRESRNIENATVCDSKDISLRKGHLQEYGSTENDGPVAASSSSSGSGSYGSGSAMPRLRLPAAAQHVDLKDVQLSPVTYDARQTLQNIVETTGIPVQDAALVMTVQSILEERCSIGLWGSAESCQAPTKVNEEHSLSVPAITPQRKMGLKLHEQLTSHCLELWHNGLPLVLDITIEDQGNGSKCANHLVLEQWILQNKDPSGTTAHGSPVASTSLSPSKPTPHRAPKAPKDFPTFNAALRSYLKLSKLKLLGSVSVTSGRKSASADDREQELRWKLHSVEDLTRHDLDAGNATHSSLKLEHATEERIFLSEMGQDSNGSPCVLCVKAVSRSFLVPPAHLLRYQQRQRTQPPSQGMLSKGKSRKSYTTWPLREEQAQQQQHGQRKHISREQPLHLKHDSPSNSMQLNNQQKSLRDAQESAVHTRRILRMKQPQQRQSHQLPRMHVQDTQLPRTSQSGAMLASSPPSDSVAALSLSREEPQSQNPTVVPAVTVKRPGHHLLPTAALTHEPPRTNARGCRIHSPQMPKKPSPLASTSCSRSLSPSFSDTVSWSQLDDGEDDYQENQCGSFASLTPIGGQTVVCTSAGTAAGMVRVMDANGDFQTSNMDILDGQEQLSQAVSKATTPKRTLRNRSPPPPAATRPQRRGRFLGGFESSLWHGNGFGGGKVSTVPGYTLEVVIVGNGRRTPPLRLPFAAHFEAKGGNNLDTLPCSDQSSSVSVPYTALVALRDRLRDGDNELAPNRSTVRSKTDSYQACPSRGLVQLSLFNPQGTVLKIYIVKYDLTDLQPGDRTMVRQRHFQESDGCLKYGCQLHFMSSKRKGKLYLYGRIRLVFPARSPDDDQVLKTETLWA